MLKTHRTLIGLILALAAHPAAEAACPPAKPSPQRGTPPIDLDVVISDPARGIVEVRERLPVRGAREVTLHFPAWMPGNPAVRGPLQNLAALTATAEGRPVRWRRDANDVWAFRFELPPGARHLDLSFKHLSPLTASQGRVMFSPDMGNLQWNAVLLYPKGSIRKTRVEASLKLPAGWRFASALPVAAREDDRIQFANTDLETLIDSPVYAGRYATSLILDPKSGGVRLNVFADSSDLLPKTEAQVDAHRRLVAEADALFGHRPFCSYDFLLSLSSHLGTIGFEHAASSENGTDAGYFAQWDRLASTRMLLSHEYVHAWNGKFRAPAGLWQDGYNSARRNDLLWVYEGLTHYLGYVLAARSGLLDAGSAHDALAVLAAELAHRPGRHWRSLEDTTNSAAMSSRRPLPWPDYMRNLDYYEEGVLLWLEVDTLIRAETDGRRSLDDFVRAFYARNTPYTFDEVVRGLQAVAPYDWRGFLEARTQGLTAMAPLDGLRRGGYRLDYAATPSAYVRDLETRQGLLDLRYPIGLRVTGRGAIESVLWDSPAFQAGFAPGMTITGVDSRPFSADILRHAARRGPGEITVSVRHAGTDRSLSVHLPGPVAYPRLVPALEGDRILDEILRSRVEHAAGPPIVPPN